MGRIRAGAGRMRGVAILGAAAAAILVASCAGAPRRPPSGQLAAPGARLALLPLENLTGQADAAGILTRMVFVELVRLRECEVVESGITDTALIALRIRDTGSLNSAQLAGLGETLGVTHVMVGSVLESGTVRTPDGEVPAIGVALKLLEVRSGRPVWARMGFRTGDDRETVFGWGRERDPRRLAATLVAELLRDFAIPPPVRSRPQEGGAG